jgi:phosphate-selective porin OprO/OprP
VAVRYSYLDLTDADIAGGRDQSLTAGLNWHWTAYSKLQMEAAYGEITGHAPVGGFTRGDYSVAAMRFSIDF